MGATTVPETILRPFLGWEVLLGQALRSGTGRKRNVLVAPKNASGGTAAVNTLYRLPDETTAATLGGYGSPAHRQRIVAREANRNVEHWVVFAADADVATQGTGTTTVTGTSASESKTMKIRIGDTTVRCSIVSGDLLAVVGAAMAAAINADTSLPVTAVYNAGTLTLTAKANGTGSSSIEWYITDVPAGITLGTPIGACAAGTGVPKWADAYAAIEASTYKFSYIVPATATLTEINTGTGNLRDRLGGDALASVRKRMQVILANKDTQAGQATFCDGLDTGTVTAAEPGWRFSTLWYEEGLVEEWVFAARWASQRCGLEESDPNVVLGGFDGLVITGAVPPPAELGNPLPDDIEAALHSGGSPVVYDHEAGTCRLILSITCKDTTASEEDLRAFCTNKITCCDFIADDLEVQEYDKYNGKKVASDDATGLPPDGLPKNTTTPSLIGDFVCDRLNAYHYGEKGLIEPVVRSAVTTERNVVNPRRVDHWADVSVIPWPLQFAGEIHEVSP